MRTSWRVFILWFLASSIASAAIQLGSPFVNERLHLRIRPPKGWLLANKGLTKGEPVEFWKEDAYGPRIQVLSYSFPVEMTHLDQAQKELSQTLLEQFPGLDIVEEKQLSHKGHPAIEVMATLEIEDTFYHVIQRCIFARARVYIITCASFESTFISDMPLFRASLDSIDILGEIYDPNIARGRRGHLIQPTVFGVGALVFLGAGFILRRLSATRLRRQGLGR